MAFKESRPSREMVGGHEERDTKKMMDRIQEEADKLEKEIQNASKILKDTEEITQLWKETLAVAALDVKTPEGEAIMRTLEETYSQLSSAREFLKEMRPQFIRLIDLKKTLGILEQQGVVQVAQA